MHYLITGGAGFIGSHLVERLLDEGAWVTVLDDFSTGRETNLAAVVGRRALRIERGSVGDARSVDQAMAAVDSVLHLAAAVGVELVTQRPLAAIEGNASGTINVLAAAARRGLPVLLASSSEVYGEVAGPCREEALPRPGSTAEPRSGYAYAKALEECLALAHHRERGLPVRVVRLFNVAGPRQRGCHGMVLPRFARQALTGRPLTVHGDGAQTRAFCHVADAVDAIVRLLSIDAAVGQVVNVGDDRPIGIGVLAMRVRAAAASGSEIVHVPLAAVRGRGGAEIRRRVPDLTRLQALIGRRPRLDLDRLIGDVVDDQRRELARIGAELGAAAEAPLRAC